MWGWDTETGLIRPALLAPPLVCVSWATPEGRSGVVHHRESFGLLKQILEGESTGANVPYDLAVIGNRFPELMPDIFQALADDRIHDVLMRQKLMDIAAGCYRSFIRVNGEVVKATYSLADLSRRHGVAELDKDPDTYRLRYGELYDVPIENWPAEAVEYARMDAVSTLKIHLVQDQKAALLSAEYQNRGWRESVLHDEAAQVRAHWALHLSACWGIRTDQQAVVALERRLDAEYEHLRDFLKEAGLLHTTGARNMKAAKERMKAALGDKCKLTEKGKLMVQGGASPAEAIEAGYICLDEEACLISGDPVLERFVRFSHIVKLKSTYIPAMRKGFDTPIQSRFEPLLATGRTSSSDPNIQNLPRGDGVRECFVPRAGHVFVACDFDKAELCSLAEVCMRLFGVSRLADRLNAKFDPHLDMGAQLMGISYEEALRRFEDPEVKRFRQMAKAANFGLPGGLGPSTFRAYAKGAYNVDLSFEQAVDLRNRWFRAWPEMRQYFDWINAHMEGQYAWIQQFESKRYRGRIKYTVCCNTFFQGLTADASKAALWEVTRRQFCVPTSALYGTHVEAFIHDELIVSCLEHKAHAVAMELREVMIEVFRRYHPHLYNAVGATPVVMRRWSKDAKQIWSGGKPGVGELLPWDLPALAD